MVPLASPCRCDRCLQLTQTITKLEGHISNLYHLRDEEVLRDNLATVGASTVAATTELDDTISVAVPPTTTLQDITIPAAAPTISAETEL